jgi:hypothetical protein
MSDNENPVSWQEDLIDSINKLERKLDDYRGHIGANQSVKDEYFIALKKIAEAKEALSRLAETFNKEYASG